MENRNGKILLQINELLSYDNLENDYVFKNRHEIMRMRHINYLRSSHQNSESFKRKDETITIGDVTVEGDSYDIDKDHVEEVMTQAKLHNELLFAILNGYTLSK